MSTATPASPSVLETIRAAKTGERPRVIPLVNRDAGTVIGRAEVLGAQHLDDTLVDRFVRWRNQNRAGWLDQRLVTVDTTKAWLTSYLSTPDMMIYLLFSGDTLVGRTGLLNLTRESFLTDGMLRGERGGGMHFFKWANASLMPADTALTGVRFAESKMLDHNEFALESSNRLGFQTVRTTALYRHQDERGLFLTESPGEGGVLDDRKLLYRRVQLA